MGTDLAEKISRAIGIVPDTPFKPKIDDASHGEFVQCNDECARTGCQEKVHVEQKRQQEIKGEENSSSGQNHGPMGISAIENFCKTVKYAA